MKSSTQENLHTMFGPMVTAYDRDDAIADGHLFDVTDMARQVGFQWPVALTAAVWCDCVSWSDEDSRAQIRQDPMGRLWDVLYMAFLVIHRTSVPKDRMTFSFFRVPRDGTTREPEEVVLKLIVAVGDAGEPIVTILMPEEN